MEKIEKELISPSEHITEVLENQELYSPHGIEEYYQNSITSIHAQIMKLEQYVQAKQNEPVLAAEISDLITRRPSNGLTLMEKMNELQNYERIIKFFEDKNIPDEMLQTTKETIEELRSRITELSDILKIAKEDPQAN